jgi:hypothetical protein
LDLFSKGKKLRRSA